MTNQTEMRAAPARAPMSHSAGSIPGARDPRLDFFRGLCLLMIYVNHIPGTIFEELTSRNFGLSDAAEGFVFMSGCAVALAYGPRMANGLTLPTVLKSWGRAWSLYIVHILTTVWAMAIVAGAVLWFGADEVLKNNSFIMMWRQPVEVTLGVATLGHQFGYVNILPMYAVLMLAAPFLVWLGMKSPKALLGGSILFWVLTGMLKLNLPNYPQPGGWFFNPFAWQLIFSLGILTGLGMRAGVRFAPIRSWLFWIAMLWLVFCFVWVKDPELKDLMSQGLRWLYEAGVPPLVTGFDKTYVSVPRLSHFLALAYVLSMPGLVVSLAAARMLEPVRLIGRHSLLIFAVGTVLAILSQTIRDVHATDLSGDILLVFGGILLQWGIAWVKEWNARTGGTLPPRRQSLAAALPLRPSVAR